MGAVGKQQLGKGVNVLKLAMDGSPETLRVLHAVKGAPVDHLRDVLNRIEGSFRMNSQTRKPFHVSACDFDELLVSLAGLDAASVSAVQVSSSSSTAAAAASPSASSVLTAALDATLTQMGGIEFVDRLRRFMEICKVKPPTSEAPGGKQLWNLPRLRILALALSSLSVLSDVLIDSLAASDAAVLAARPVVPPKVVHVPSWYTPAAPSYI